MQNYRAYNKKLAKRCHGINYQSFISIFNMKSKSKTTKYKNQ